MAVPFFDGNECWQTMKKKIKIQDYLKPSARGALSNNQCYAGSKRRVQPYETD